MEKLELVIGKHYNDDEIGDIEEMLDRNKYYIETVEVGIEKLAHVVREIPPVPEIIIEEYEKRSRLTALIQDIQQVDLLGMDKESIDAKRLEAKEIIERLRVINKEKAEQGLE